MRRLMTAAAVILGLYLGVALVPTSSSLMAHASTTDVHVTLSTRGIVKTAIGVSRALAVRPVETPTLVARIREAVAPTVSAQFGGSCDDDIATFMNMGLWYYGMAYQIEDFGYVPDGFAGAGTHIGEFVLFYAYPICCQEAASDLCTFDY